MPQHLLLTLLGDYWRGLIDPIPSAALVRLLGEFGVSTPSARVAIGRLTKRGVLVRTRSGRNTAYNLSPSLVSGGMRSLPRLLSFGGPDDANDDWDGTWIVVSLTFPPEQGDVRRSLRAGLRSIGFAELSDSIWLSASTKREPVAELLAGFDVASLVIHGTILHPVSQGSLDLHASWPLDSVRQAYERFIDDFTAVNERALKGKVSLADALILRTQIMDRWRGLFRRDPALPSALLPDDWPRAHARELLVSTYDALGPLAELRCRQLLADIEGGYPPPRYTPVSSANAEAEPTAVKDK